MREKSNQAKLLPLFNFFGQNPLEVVQIVDADLMDEDSLNAVV